MDASESILFKSAFPEELNHDFYLQSISGLHISRFSQLAGGKYSEEKNSKTIRHNTKKKTIQGKNYLAFT